ncbi:MAG: hypothetical protein FWD05_05565 [Oscillospiraceae bacterium]|nr:hypothetical protein [Oscillospiraceae bacterium]
MGEKMLKNYFKNLGLATGLLLEMGTRKYQRKTDIQAVVERERYSGRITHMQIM